MMLFASVRFFLFSLVFWMFFVPEGILVRFSKPVSGFWMYNGEKQSIELSYVEFSHPIEHIIIPYRRGDNILVLKKDQKTRSISYTK